MTTSEAITWFKNRGVTMPGARAAYEMALDALHDQHALKPYAEADRKGRLHILPPESSVAQALDFAKQVNDMGLNFAEAIDMLKRLEAENSALREQLARVVAERDAALEDLNGLCWCCVHGRPAKIGHGGLTTCDYMDKRGTIACAGKSKCEHWQWHGLQKEV